MGYYTRYKLDFYSDAEGTERFDQIDRVVGDLENLKSDAELAKEFGFQYDWESEALHDIYTDQAGSMTFYYHEEPMRALSKRHPDVICILSGEGEEAGDIWKKYFKNGKMQECRARIEFDEYDEDLLE